MGKKIRPFGISDKVGYMLGDLANDFTFIFASSYVMVFYSKVMGIDTKVIGTMFLVARCLDAFTDIGMGRLVDVAKPAKDGKFRCWLRRMMGFVALASFMMYQAFFRDAAMGIRIAYMFVTYILWGSVFYTAIDIPYGSMASAISDEQEHRSSLSVWRSLGSILAAIIVRVVSPLVIYYKDADGNEVVHSGRFTMIAGVFSLCAVVCYLLCYFMTTERVKTEAEKEPGLEIHPDSLLQSLKSIFTDRAFLGMILSAVAMIFATLIGQGLDNFLFADYFGNVTALSIYSILALPATLLLAAVSTPIALRFGKKESGVFCFAVAGAVYLIIAAAKIRNVWVFIALAFVAVLAKQCFGMQSYALVNDVIDNHGIITGNRNEGMIYGAYSFSRKIGQAIAGGISGWALSAIGYDSAAIVQTQAVKDGIYLLSAVLPAISYLLCAVILAFLYPLNKEKVNSNSEILKKQQK